MYSRLKISKANQERWQKHARNPVPMLEVCHMILVCYTKKHYHPVICLTVGAT